MMYRVYDNIPAKHKHTLSALALQSTLDMRHYSNLGCKMYKACIAEKARLFSLSLGYCEDLQDSLNHLYDMDLLSGKTKCTLDAALDGISNLYLYREQAQARLNSYLGLLRWSHSYNLRKAQMIRLQASKWAQIFRFPVGYEKVEIKASKSKMEHYRRLNKIRYRQQLSISNAI